MEEQSENRSNGSGYKPRGRSFICSDSYDVTGKVMLIGDSGVGKTCLLVRFKDGTFLKGNFISTVGIDFRNKLIDVEGTKIKLQIWDTAGQERFRSITRAYYRDANALLLLYDVTSRKTFENTRAWLSEIQDYSKDEVVVMLLGNKADCAGERRVSSEEGEKLAEENGIAFMETSSKSGLNVDLAFMAVARNLLEQHSEPERGNGPRFSISDYVNKEKQSSSRCCNGS